MEVIFYNFAKRRNSLKVPSAESGTIVDCVIKKAINIISPSFIIESISMPTWNYCFTFGRYYFVKALSTGINNFWGIECEEDTLATHRDKILLTTALVMRSASNYNPAIDDNFIMPTTHVSYEFQSRVIPYITNGGVYCLQVISGGGGSSLGGFAKTYLMGASQMAELANILTNRDFVTSIGDAVNNPLSTIVSLKWIPLFIGTYIGSGALEEISIGGQPTGIQASVLGGNYSAQTSMTFSLAQPNEDNSFLYGDKYLSYDLFIPALGQVHISGQDVLGSSDITVMFDFSVDGDIIAYVLRGGAQSLLHLIGSLRGNVAHNIPVAMTNNPYATSAVGTMIGGLGATLGGTLAGNAGIVVGGIGALATGVGQFMYGKSTSMQGGYDGARNVFTTYDSVILRKSRYLPSEEPAEIKQIIGRPLAQMVKLSTLTGYVQTQGFSIDCDAPLEEVNEINSMLNGGVYIE